MIRGPIPGVSSFHVAFRAVSSAASERRPTRRPGSPEVNSLRAIINGVAAGSA